MIHPLDDRLREEARRYRLVFACPDCASFDPADAGEGGDRDERDARGAAPPGRAPRCSLGYPVAPHVSRSLDDRDEVIFCKAFELR
ncbi:hypothetical protein WME76_34155 [Sorangium sp. So ce119]|uniref:hypothetical protein n=1 Tax=Sorangium sp. So ce119 TaxID=3133279 RepID=UPI000779173C|nr:hypothetical protein BE11_07755 [Sorangium cellulosum]